MGDGARMRTDTTATAGMRTRIALIDGPPAVRHARLLMLRAEGFDVRAYASAAPLLADPRALASACIVAEVANPETGGVALVHAMRQQGWHGAVILLTQALSPALGALALERDLTVLAPTGLADGLLLAAIRTAIADHGDPLQEGCAHRTPRAPLPA